MINDEELLALKGKVKSLEEFKKLASKNNLNYSDKELQEGYDYFLELCKDQEMSLDELEEVSGGAGNGNIGPTHAKCWKCHTKIVIPYKSYTYCSNCNSKNDGDNCYRGPC